MNSRLTGARLTPTDAAAVSPAAKGLFFHAAKESKTRLARTLSGYETLAIQRSFTVRYTQTGTAAKASASRAAVATGCAAGAAASFRLAGLSAHDASTSPRKTRGAMT